MKNIKEIWDWIKALGLSFVVAMLITIFVFQPFKVEGHSMDPTLRDNERIYVSKLSHTFSYLPEYGDIVIIDSRVERKRTFRDDLTETPFFSLFTSKEEGRTFYVKRVIGKPGDVLEFKENKVIRNGEALDEPYIKETMQFVSDKKWVVPKDSVFVMGDNRNNSRDSRDIGFIPLDHIIGKKVFDLDFSQ